MTEISPHYSIFQCVLFMMIPTVGEALRNSASSCGNLAWYGISNALLFGRNTFYVAIFSLFLAWYFQDNSVAFYLALAVSALCGLIGTNIFFDYIPYVYHTMNQKK